MMRQILTAVFTFLSLGYLAAQNGPTMGWSSWNTYGVNISDALIRRQADAMVSKGLKDVGFNHINIDDGFFGGRNESTGELLIHPTRFPNGLKPVVEYIHSKDLKAGRSPVPTSPSPSAPFHIVQNIFIRLRMTATYKRTICISTSI